MATNRPLPSPLPADLPEDWQDGQIVAPEGADVGLTEQHGYNYLMQQVNDAQRAANQMSEDKQDKLTGAEGQVVGFDKEGNTKPVEALPVKVNILEVICENIEFSDSSPTYTFPQPISLDADAWYYLQYKYSLADGTPDVLNGGGPMLFSKVSDGVVRWLSAAENNSLTLTSTEISDTWRGNGKTAHATIYKINVEIVSALNFGALNKVGYETVSSGSNSYAEGVSTTASGSSSHAEGRGTTASELNSHAEGEGTTASGRGSHAEGNKTIAAGMFSHAEGLGKILETGYAAHAEGSSTASGARSHAEGEGTKASANDSHAEGFNTTASNSNAHAEGSGTTASGINSHAEGSSTTASGNLSHAEGSGTVAKGQASHAGCDNTIANDYQTVVGTYNVENTTSNSNSGARFIVGGGMLQARKNAFRVDASGACYGSGAWNTSGADYAELFEWQDGNPDKEDRAGLFVTLDGDRIRIAGPEDDYILGIVSAVPSVVGDVYDDQWAGMYLRDVFGRTIIEEQDFLADTREVPGENGEMETVEIRPAFRAPAPVVNPEYNHTEPYQPRTQRPEWDAVGLLGKLVAVDDGTCQVNGWATVGVGGVATASPERTKYRIMARLDDTHVRVMIL